MLLADLKLCREIIIFFVTALVVPDVIAGQAANAHPVRLSLPFRAEGRTYAHPVFRHRVSDTDNIAKTVVRTACEGGIGVPLLCATVDDFGQVRNGRDLHFYLGPGRAAGFGISKRAYLRVIPGITWGILVNGVHTHQVGKTPGRSCRSVGGHNACLGVGRIRHAYHRLKGLSLVIRSNVRGCHQLAHHIPELGDALLFLFLFPGFLLLRAKPLLAGAHDYRHGSQQSNV